MSKLKVNEIDPLVPGTGIGVGAPNTDNSAILNVQSTTQGFRFPTMTTTRRNAIVGPTNGLTIYNVDTQNVEHFNGTTWEATGGLVSLNGQADKNQLLTIGTAGFEPNITQFGVDTNTINIPIAATNGVTAGLLSHVDWQSFSDRETAPHNVLHVLKNSTLELNDFNSVADAVDSITTASAANPWTVFVEPGVYVERQIFLKPYVYLSGRDPKSCIINPQNVGLPLIIGSDNSGISNLTIAGVTSNTAVYYQGTGMGEMQLSGIYLLNNYNAVHVIANINPSYMKLNRVRHSPTPSSDTLYHVESISGAIARIEINVLAATNEGSPGPTNNFFLVHGTGASIHISDFLAIRTSSAAAFLNMYDGASVEISAGHVHGFNKGVWVQNIGAPCRLDIMGMGLIDLVQDISIEHPGTTGNFSGVADRTKVFIDPDANVSLFYNDNTNQGTVSLGPLFLGDHHADLVDGNYLIQRGFGCGVFPDHEDLANNFITHTGVLEITVQASRGFVMSQTLTTHKYIDTTWPDTAVSVPANSNLYVAVNTAGAFVLLASDEDSTGFIILGRVVSNASDIEFIDLIPINQHHIANLHEDFLRDAIGGLYVSGSLITENGTRRIDVGSGDYYFGQAEFFPSGGLAVSLKQFHRNGSGGYTKVVSSTVDNAFYDDGTGALHALTSGYWAKHSVYVGGDGLNETYFLVYSQTEYSALALAEQSALPTPPSYFEDGIVLIGSIIVQQGVTHFSEIRDERPIIGTKAGTVSATTFHGNLLGLGNDDHPQYLLTTGTRSMAGNLQMGGNAITGASTYNGVVVETHATRHNFNGADPLLTGTPSELTDSTNIEGLNNTHVTRLDHQHSHGNRGGGSLHAAATTSVSGFLSAANKTTYDAAVTALNSHVANTSNPHSTTAAQVGAIPTTLMTTLGDLIYGGASGVTTRLAGDTSNTRKFLREQSTASVATAPAWDTIQAGDVPTLNQNTTGTAASFTGSLAGDVTGTQGSTAIAAATVTGKLITGYVSGAGTVAATDSILQAIQKLNGNDALKLLLAGGTMSGNIAMGGNAITGASTYNGVTVEAHASRHIPGGADALSTATAATQIPDQTNAVGTSTSFARADHIHNIPAAVPVSTGSTNTKGTSTSFSLADHIHNTVLVTSEASDAVDTTTTSLTDVLLTNMTLTPTAGTYFIEFSCFGENSNNGKNEIYSIYVNGVQQTATERVASTNGAVGTSVATQCVAAVNGSQAIEIRWRVTANTGTTHQRRLTLIRVG